MYHALKALAHERLHELTLFWYHFFISFVICFSYTTRKKSQFLAGFPVCYNRQSLEEHPFPCEVNPRNVLLWRVHGVCLSFSG